MRVQHCPLSLLEYICRIEELAYTRSGDKGNHCNIGVVSRTPSIYPVLLEHLTAERVAEYFRHTFDAEPEVIRSAASVKIIH